MALHTIVGTKRTPARGRGLANATAMALRSRSGRSPRRCALSLARGERGRSVVLA